MKKKQNYYGKHARDLKQRLKASLDIDELRDLHRVRPARHFLVVLRLVTVTLLCAGALWQSRWPLLWAPAAILQGFNLLGFVILLHEQVHDAIFETKRPRLQRLLGILYAMPTGISSTQFKIWHLDHHNELGTTDDDPKRAHLSPKRNRRWFKLLYMTPMLFVIYARASALEAANYAPEAQRKILFDRLRNVVAHLGVIGLLLTLGGGWELLRVYAIPLFFGFPAAFVVNRLGQHYDIDSTDPAKWSTLVNGNAAWRFVFLWSNHHIEHHYYPRVPFYNLPKLNRKLQPFFRGIGHESRGYGKILWNWLVRNREAHTNWNLAE